MAVRMDLELVAGDLDMGFSTYISGFEQAKAFWLVGPGGDSWALPLVLIGLNFNGSSAFHANQLPPISKAELMLDQIRVGNKSPRESLLESGGSGRLISVAT